MRAAVLVVVLAAVYPVAAQVPQTGDPLMDYRLRAARAEREHVERCHMIDEIDELTSTLAGHVAHDGVLDSKDGKSIDRIRKLARKLRSGLGAFGDPKMADRPTTVRAVADALQARGDALVELVRKSTRYEVSARMLTVVDEIIVLSDALDGAPRGHD